MFQPWKICFFQKGHAPEDDGSTFACCVSKCAGTGNLAEWAIKPQGIVFSGRFEQVLNELKEYVVKGNAFDALIIFFASKKDNEKFLHHLIQYTGNIPIVGGIAGQNIREQESIIPVAEEVSLLAIRDHNWSFSSLWRNIHETIEGKVLFRASGTRTLLSIRESDFDSPAQQWYKAKRTFAGYRLDSYENIALSTMQGINIHVSAKDDFALSTGADLPFSGELLVRSVTDENAFHRVGEFCSMPNTLIFGCAGLATMFDGDLKPGQGTLAGFFFGEVMPLKEGARFTNLMMTGLKADRK